jgi:hypothetical protein
MVNGLNFSYSRVECGVVYENKTFVADLFKILRSSAFKWAVKIETLENKIHGRVKILGWQHGTFSGRKLLGDSKNVYVLCVWWSLSTAKHHLREIF